MVTGAVTKEHMRPVVQREIIIKLDMAINQQLPHLTGNGFKPTKNEKSEKYNCTKKPREYIKEKCNN